MAATRLLEILATFIQLNAQANDKAQKQQPTTGNALLNKGCQRRRRRDDICAVVPVAVSLLFLWYIRSSRWSYSLRSSDFWRAHKRDYFGAIEWISEMRTIVSLTTLLLVGRKKKKSVESTSGRAVLVSSTLLLLMLLSVQILLETDLDGKKTQFLFLIKVVFTFLYLHVISLFLVQKKFALFFLLFGNLDMKWNQNVVRSFYTGSNSNLLSLVAADFSCII